MCKPVLQDSFHALVRGTGTDTRFTTLNGIQYGEGRLNQIGTSVVLHLRAFTKVM